MMNKIEKTIVFLNNLFDQSEHLKDKPLDKQYRLEHTYRVASIGKFIAMEEQLDVEATVIGCLLHDISYIYPMETRSEWINHGRKSASMCKDFVNQLEMKSNLKQELLYGIAIHVDDISDFDGERTLLAETIGEADNIDRFDKYRLYEALVESKLNEKTLQNQIEYVSHRITRLEELKTIVHKTKTSNRLWNEKLDFQISFYSGLLHQLKTSIDTTLTNI